MNEDPVTKIGAKLAAKINLGDFNNVELTVWIDDRVRPTDGSTSNAMDRLTKLLDSKLEAWAKDFKDD